MIVSNSIIRVRYAETDMMGIAYYGNYFTWFEVARIHLLDSLGIPYRKLEEQGYRLPVLETKAVYKQSVHFDDNIEIKAFLKEMPTVRFTINYELYVESHLVSTGYTCHAFTNITGQPIKPPGIFMIKLKNIFK